ncbi:MAG TPA: malic enzyme-like NAD(P)-binding protein [Isosphaeraceae bacterium]|nr:malic enzyme-like NAD(P)-binding protein [Isosphaeraceae bacterium]
MDEPGDTRQWFDVLLTPDAHVLEGNPSLGGNGGRLHHDESDFTCLSAAKVDDVPVGGQPVVSAVLTHRRHHDPIAEGDTPDRQRVEQVDFGNFKVGSALPASSGSGTLFIKPGSPSSADFGPVSDSMFMAAARALADYSTASRDLAAPLLPPLAEPRRVSRAIALAVATAAQHDGLATLRGAEELGRLVDAKIWQPRYLPITLGRKV